MNERESERSMVANPQGLRWWSWSSGMHTAHQSREEERVEQSPQRTPGGGVFSAPVVALLLSLSRSLALSCSLVCYTALVRSLHLVSAFEWCG